VNETSTSARRSPGWDPVGDNLLLAAVMSATSVGLAVLVTGHLSAFVLHGHWPNYPLDAAPQILGRWGRHLRSPEVAWRDVNTGAAVAGGAVWWVLFGVVSCTMAAPAIVAVRSRPPDGQTWAKPRDLRRLRVGHEEGRLVVGRHGRRLVAVEARHSLLVLGPTQSGKTTGLAVPAILEWPGPVVATSTKGDLVDDTIGWRRRLGQVHVYDPAGATSYVRSGWSPLAKCMTWQGSCQTGWELAMAGKAAVGGGMNLADFWFAGAAKALAPYLYAAAWKSYGIGRVARWIDDEERDEVLAILKPLHLDAASAHQATFRREDRSRSSLFQVMQQIVGAYLDPAVVESARSSDIDPERLLDGGANTLYLTAPHRDQERFRPLFSTLIGQVIDAVYRRHVAEGRPLDAPLLLVLDEAANIAPLDDLPTIASTAAASGLQVITVFQDLAQVRRRFGDAAGTVVNNHRAKLLLPGISDLDTLDLASRLVGEEETERSSTTTDGLGRRSRTSSAQWRRLLPAEMARQLGDGEGVLLYGNLRPIRVRLRPWFKDRRLRRRARGELFASVEVDAVAAGPGAEVGTVSILEAAQARRLRREDQCT
jgi:type IV secretion system protein VirD4